MSFRDFDEMLEKDTPSRRSVENRPLVLVVDDDEMVRRSLRAVLSARYELRLCASALEGLSALNEDVAVVILDVKMQGHDGFWACMQIRKRYPDLPVIFYSAYQDIKNPYDIINEMHPYGYVIKDGSTRTLLDLVEGAARLSVTRREYKRVVESVRAGRLEIEQSLRKTRPPPSG
jgi:DNA-binding NtrC family response regulator